MKIAVEGCCHGELDKIYETLAYLEEKNNVKVDLLLICGDFQAVRNKSDLETMAVPPKYRKLNTFWKYYAGLKVAPVLTVFIGGNHEASNYLQELPYGGWVATNIYYMGYAGVIQFGGVRITGLSGIFKGRDYQSGHFEHAPYSEDTKRSCYHIRNLEVFRLKQLQKPIDIILSHDWPRGIYNYGNVKALLQKKKFFREEVNSGTLGSPPAEELLFALKPSYWFSAHLHVKFAALVEHELDSGEQKQTKFLSLDKCLPKRNFLQIIDVPSVPDKPLELELDPEWLCVLKSTNHLMSLTKARSYMPGPGSNERWNFTPTSEELESLSEDFGGLFKIPENFEKTVPAHDPNQSNKSSCGRPKVVTNPQTSLLCEMLGILDPSAFFLGKQQHQNIPVSPIPASDNDSSFFNESSFVNDSDFVETTVESSSLFETTPNPDEISLDDLDDGDDEEETEDKESDEKDEPSPGDSAPQSDDLVKTRLFFSGDDVSLDSSSQEAVLSAGSQSPDSNVLDCQHMVNTSQDSTSSGSSPLKRGAEAELKVVSEQTCVDDKPKKFKRRNQSFYSSEENV